MPHRRLGLVCALALFVLPVAARAQSFDCAKAQNPVDKAICASPRLRQLDKQVADAYAAALKRDAGKADAIRQAQRNWAKDRATCLSGAKPPASHEPCLATAYSDRLAALAPAAASAPARSAAVATPQAVAPLPAPAPPAAARSSAPSFAQARPATGLPALPAGAATLERDHFPTAGETDVLLHVTTPGRFAILAASPTGTALQLVDMLTGPGDRQGWPGKQDGRIDALLDTGTYKLRVFGDKAATGDTTLSLVPFTQAAPAQLAPGYQPVALTLADLQLQSFWLVVGDTASTRIEAAGRSLAALKLWRDGRDLVDLAETTSAIAANPAHPLTDIVLSGHVPPGTYLVTAYGGPALPWTDGAADQPLYLRTGRSTDLLAGGTSSAIGVFGSETFDLPPDAANVLLILPQPAEAHLSATAPGSDMAAIDLTKQDRARSARLALPGKAGTERFVELAAAPGQTFTLRSLAAAGSPPSKPGRIWLGVVEAANGGDEAPAAALLTRTRIDAASAQPEILASPGVPAIGPGKAWRSRFNLRGNTTLLFHATGVVTVALRTEGPPVTSRIVTLGGAVMNAMGNGNTATSWSLSPGWYVLALTVKPEVAGILDLTLGPPGLIPQAAEAAGPEAPVLPLGEQSFDPQFRLGLVVNRVPDGASNLLVRPLPVELADGPLVQTMPAGEPLRLQVHAKNAGLLVMRDIAAAAPIESRAEEDDTTTTVNLPAADHARTVAIAVLPPMASATPEPAAAAELEAMRDGQPVFLDLDRGAQAGFALTVQQGGLYRVETTGRLKTDGRIGTAFIPVLDQASANGVGSNMLLQRYLRAGRYRLDVTARDSAGRLGIAATATPLAEGAELLPGGSVRATLSPDHGIGFPIRIAAAGRYHLDLLGDSRRFAARLEDADGWPLLAASDLSSIDQDLAPGRYRLIVQPAAVQARVVARLRRIEPAVTLSGHGPHALPFDVAQSLEWREPPGRDDPRTPDTWGFSLAGPAKVTLSLTGDGMAAALRPETADAAAAPLGRLLAGTPLVVDLPAGRYRVAASSLGRNDRLAYSIVLHSAELQPDTPRRVTLPAELPFAVADARVVSLTSFGRTPMRAALRDAAGHVLARAAGRTDDWNVALSQFLPAGRYTLALAPLVPPGAASSSDNSDDSSDSSANTGMAADNSDDAESNAPGDADQASDDNSGQGQQSADQGGDSAPDKSPARTEVTLVLPADQPAVALAADGTAVVQAGGIQHVTLPAAPAGSLLVAAAEAPVEQILALEQRGAGGAWHTVGQAQGLAPILGIPVGDPAAARRLSVWTVDGGVLPIRVAVRAVSATPAAIGTVPLAPVALGGITRHWNAGPVADPGSLMLRLTAPVPGLLAASAADQPAAPPADAMIVAQSNIVWLLSPDATPPQLAVVETGPDATVAVGVPASGRASLPIAAPGTSKVCAYVAASGLGQPGLQAGRGMGVAAGSAFALCGGTALTAWNADGDAALRLRLRRHELTMQPEAVVDQAFAGILPPRTALPLRLAAGTHRLDASLAAGGALVAGWQQQDAVTAWTGETALTRSLTGGWTEALLINTGDTPAPATLTVTAVPQPLTLASGGIFRRFFGAGGSFVLPLTGKSGQRLVLAGAAEAALLRPDGQVRRGPVIPLDGPASAVVTHAAGPLALWIEGQGASPWPDARPRDVSLPQRVTLENEAMALRLSPGAPILLRLASTAPAILALGNDRPDLFGQGVTLARYLPAGEAVLRLLSPQDGPLSGTLELSATPVVQVGEGLGAPVAIPPGGAAVFGFTVGVAGPVGLGVRADPDRVAARLLDEHGQTLQRGVSMLRHLEPGRYLLEASVPPDAPTTLVRPAVLGIVPHPNPPPQDEVRRLLLAAGFAPPDSAR